MLSRTLSALALLFFLSFSASAQNTLQDPSSYLGYELGSKFSRHADVVGYFEHVAELSDRVQIEHYGKTNEGRPLMVAFVSSPENMTRLDEIRNDNLRLAGLEDGKLKGDPPTIVWLSYNVHGNESNSTEASMSTLFALVNPGAESSAWLENTVVVLDPAINPDGRDRYANWYNMMVGMEMNVSKDAVEHAEPWPGGRTNHYYFDLNRDWSWQTQVETRQRMQLYKKWMPHVHVDFHEQGINSPYYFAPAAEPVHENVTAWQRELEEIIGRNNARHFDREGWLYFTKQSFDILYPGYGDSFPMFNGAVGMTYEQAGGGGAGLGVLTVEGDTLTLLDRLTHHTAAGLSTIEATSLHQQKVVSEFRTYFEQAISNPPGQYKAYVIHKDSPGDRVAALTAHLDDLGLDYGRATSGSRVQGLNYRTSATGRFQVQEGDLVIPASQPRAVLANVLFSPQTAMTDSLTYDITAWALPWVYDVNALASNQDVEFGPWSTTKAESKNHAEAPYAYVSSWDDAGDAAFLSALLKAGFKVRFASKPFSLHGSQFAAGSLIITRTNNEKKGASLHTELAELAGTYNQVVTGLATGFVDSGSDLGSSDVRFLDAPRVAMPFGAGTSSSAVGQVWHWFDQVIDYPLTRFPVERFSSLELDKYDVLVLPTAATPILNEAGLKKLSSWIRSGGRLVATGSGASALAGKTGFDLTMKPSKKVPDTTAVAVARNKRYEDRSRDRAPSSNPGAIYRVDVDSSHPLGFGFGDTSFVLRMGSTRPAIMKGSNSWNVGVVTDGGRVSGHTGFKAEQQIEESLAFGEQSIGSGSVIYLMDNPLYRGFWTSGRMLFANAVFFVGQ
ncbi:MAG: zinc carboxypeptidase [Bacteroidetes Order II. Incertae sedis bacterium]|jgi:hypothetical protein|nr:zinc carboxypeptidase [Bacteroidetes Order II. bacterium]MBT5249612.1 zinc carboxypeptidase [Bacteroidetes Order II. bacterium]MBT6199663.1 zinc carboxypeptidase [Bacteroidetes Order II. bacterium]MBT6425143.1 zinc carboxypeptidase [Bacteroidetes Order II. bacterium]MBT6582604.1 zinc carboxypeptidase [Bacteroidetes Order II. bacterium]